MKVFVLATATTLGLAHAATCDTASVTALLTSTDVTTCASDSGYSPSSLATPTDAEMEIMCTSTSCQSVLSDLTKMFTEECTVGTFALYADLITPVTTFCSSASSPSSSSTAASEAATSSSASTAASASSSETASASSSETASASSAAVASSASLDSIEEVTVAPVANTTSSASSDSDVTVGDSDSGSDLTIETQTPSTDSESASSTTDSTTSASSAADDTSSGSSAGVAVSPSAALLGSALVATAALFL